MFELAISYTIFDMATSNLNKISIYNKWLLPLRRKKLVLLSGFINFAPALPYFNFILSVSCNNDNQLTLQFPLAKGTFN